MVQLHTLLLVIKQMIQNAGTQTLMINSLPSRLLTKMPHSRSSWSSCTVTSQRVVYHMQYTTTMKKLNT